MDDVAILIKETHTTDAIGQRVATTTETEVLVREQSINRSEWSVASSKGIVPEIVLLTNRANYNGETLAKYHGETFAIYRTYFNEAKSDDIELYLGVRAGVI